MIYLVQAPVFSNTIGSDVVLVGIGHIEEAAIRAQCHCLGGVERRRVWWSVGERAGTPVDFIQGHGIGMQVCRIEILAGRMDGEGTGSGTCRNVT